MVGAAFAIVVVVRASLPIVVDTTGRYHDGTASFFVVVPEVEGEPSWQ